MLEGDPRITRALKRVKGPDWDILEALDPEEVKQAVDIHEVVSKLDIVWDYPLDLRFVRTRLFTLCQLEVASGRDAGVVTTSPRYKRTELGTRVLEIHNQK